MTAGASSDADGDVSDALELELRQLAGVRFVSFGEREGATVIELAVDADTDPDRLGNDARHLALVHLSGPLEVEIVGVDAPADASGAFGRVRLVLTVPLPGRTAVEIHLAHQDRSVTVETSAETPTECEPVASGVIDGLRRLGLPVPYEVVGALGLADDLGSGTLVVLRDPTSGDYRRGLATGRNRTEATARAVLNALNRSLQPAAAALRH